MLAQERERATHRHQMPHQRRSIHQLRIRAALTLHPTIRVDSGHRAGVNTPPYSAAS